jgi:hypothetical protein
MKKFIISIICFLIIVTALISCLGLWFTPTYTFNKNQINLTTAANEMLEGFYLEPKNSVDVLFIGNSNVYRTIGNPQLWAEFGIPAYARCSSSQSVTMSYYYLKEALKYQSPKVVVWDPLASSWDENPLESNIRWGSDSMKLSMDKLDMLNALDIETLSGTWFSYILPFFRYHSRWGDLTKADISYPYYQQPSRLKGSDYSLRIQPSTRLDDYGEVQGGEWAITDKALRYMQEMVTLCLEKGIELLFIKSPTLQWTVQHSAAVQAFCDQNDIPFIDYNTKVKELGIKAEYFEDGGYHLNFAGTQLVTRDLGSYLTENYGLTDHRGQAEYADWEYLSDTYTIEQEDYALAAETDARSYLEKLQNPRYSVAIVMRGDMHNDVLETIRPSLEQLGLNPELMSTRQSYAALLKGGKPVYERGDSSLVDTGRMVFGNDGVVQLISAGYASESANGLHGEIYYNNVLCSRNELGLNIAVYDSYFDTVIDYVSLPNGETGDITVQG